jgi:competence protein ComEC
MRSPSLILYWSFIVIVLVGLHLHRLPHGQLVVDFLDIGQGDAVFLTTPTGEHILIDGGPDPTVLEELGKVLPFLDRKIDLLVLTHPHADHLMGLISVLERYEVQRVLFSGLPYNSALYDVFLREVRLANIPLYVAEADKDWIIGDVFIDVLYPFESMLGESMSNVNNGSIVLKISHGNHSLLLMGDAEAEVEEALIQSGVNLQADVLKAGHHGSRTSSTPEFFKSVHPKKIIISCGKDNAFGHPHPETLELFYDSTSVVSRTDVDGRVRLKFSTR